MKLARDDPQTPQQDEGRSFVFVSGLGGKSIRSQSLDRPWWASVYTSSQNAEFGAVFGVFHHNGNPRRARFYFKDISGSVADAFVLKSPVGLGPVCADGVDNDGDGDVDHPQDAGCSGATDASEG